MLTFFVLSPNVTNSQNSLQTYWLTAARSDAFGAMARLQDPLLAEAAVFRLPVRDQERENASPLLQEPSTQTETYNVYRSPVERNKGLLPISAVTVILIFRKFVYLHATWTVKLQQTHKITSVRVHKKKRGKKRNFSRGARLTICARAKLKQHMQLGRTYIRKVPWQRRSRASFLSFRTPLIRERERRKVAT